MGEWEVGRVGGNKAGRNTWVGEKDKACGISALVCTG